ncbi:MAG: glycerate kinase [Bryobacteraceae bacterium]|nr:glycerate kinase [Bryobacteraceae bacterium]
MRDLRSDARAIFDAALRVADPEEAVRQTLAKLAIETPVWIVGAGKAAATMARAAETFLGDRVLGGSVTTKYGHGLPLERIELREAGHPIPDERGVAGAKRIAEIAGQARGGQTLLCLISGGASALMPLPAEGITLGDKQATTALMLACGANIHELNCVRKHLSAIKGGHLAQLAAPARVVSLILSDVIGDNLDVIGSGPTVPDSSTAAEARAILERYALWDRIPVAVRERLASGAETPKSLQGVENMIVGSNRLAAEAAMAKARELGYEPRLLSTALDGEAREVGARIARETGCVVAGGETTVTLRGKGKGGRNQELALAAAIELASVAEESVVLSAGTDGTDGPTDAAGAIASNDTVERAKKLGLDARAYLEENNSYPFFAALGDLVVTGPTGTNVMDLIVRLS